MNADVFFGATDDEMLSLLGLYALPLLVEPDRGLIDARRGAFTQVDSDALGVEFRQTELLNIGKRFLQQWAVELARGICGDQTLHKKVKEQGLTQLGAVVGLITAAITRAVPQLAAYTGLLTVLGAFIAQTGFQAFCRMLSEYDATSLTATPTA